MQLLPASRKAAVLTVLACGWGCGVSTGSPPDAGPGDAAGGDPAGAFIRGDIAGATWIATHNIVPAEGLWVFQHATAEESVSSPEWYFNLTLPVDAFPLTIDCAGNYIEFTTRGLDPERTFVSRTSTGTCSVTFDEPSTPDSFEGTFTANLTERGTKVDFAVTNGRFRIPRAP